MPFLIHTAHNWQQALLVVVCFGNPLIWRGGLTAHVNLVGEFKPKSSWISQLIVVMEQALQIHCSPRPASRQTAPLVPIKPSLWHRPRTTSFSQSWSVRRKSTQPLHCSSAGHLASLPKDCVEELMQKAAVRKLIFPEPDLLGFFVCFNIFAVVASLPGISSLVFGSYDCQWMNQEPLAWRKNPPLPWLKIGKQVKKWVNKAVGINWESPGPFTKQKEENSNAFHYKKHRHTIGFTLSTANSQKHFKQQPSSPITKLRSDISG